MYRSATTKKQGVKTVVKRLYLSLALNNSHI